MASQHPDLQHSCCAQTLPEAHTQLARIVGSASRTYLGPRAELLRLDAALVNEVLQGRVGQGEGVAGLGRARCGAGRVVQGSLGRVGQGRVSRTGRWGQHRASSSRPGQGRERHSRACPRDHCKRLS